MYTEKAKRILDLLEKVQPEKIPSRNKLISFSLELLSDQPLSIIIEKLNKFYAEEPWQHHQN